MSETTNTPTPQPLTLKLNASEIVTQLQGYLKQADQSLQQLQSNLDAGQRQVDEWKRMQLVLVGQRQVVIDLLNKTVDIPAAPATDTNTESSANGAATPPAAQ